MHVLKRNGSLEAVSYDKILRSIQLFCQGLSVDSHMVSHKTVSGLYDGVSTRELDRLSIATASGLISIDPDYDILASRLLNNYIRKEVEDQNIFSFSQSIEYGFRAGLISEETIKFVRRSPQKLNNAIHHDRDEELRYYGTKIIYDRYLLKDPESRAVFERPQYFFMRVACGLTRTAAEAIEYYQMLSQLHVMSSTPTLFNSSTRNPQMSSCYLLDSPHDSLIDIEKRHGDIAQLSKWAGGIGLNYSRIRENGSLIRGTNGNSKGIIGFLHSLDANIACVDQGGKRRGSQAIYLNTWHPDLMDFLEIKDKTGDHTKRAHNSNIANWIPDIFMRRVQESGTWSFISPQKYPELLDLFGDEFTNRYLEIEASGDIVSQLPAKKVYARMMRTLAETGNGWMCWQDASNTRANSAVNGRVVRSSNLCTEILEPTYAGDYVKVKPSDFSRWSKEMSQQGLGWTVHGTDTRTGEIIAILNGEVAVCNLASINLSRHVRDGAVDWDLLASNVKTTIKYLDRVIDRNFYPIPEARFSNLALRPVGLGIMGFQELLWKMGLNFESDQAVQLSADIQETIYFHALTESNRLAQELGPHQGWEHTHAAQGRLQFDLAGYPVDEDRWGPLREQIKQHGLRNSLLLAIAPTVTISAICGTTECIEPTSSNLFKRETLTGEFTDINRYLVRDLKSIGLWDDAMRRELIEHDGSIQAIEMIPQEIKDRYKTAWEVRQKRVIDHAVARGPFLDQGQSLNFFMGKPAVAAMSSMYMYAWSGGDLAKKIQDENPDRRINMGLKTTYYFRTKSATGIQKITSGISAPRTDLENPEVCETCT